MEPVPTFDLYAELEVSPSATTPTIDAAWKSLMKRNHPDVGGERAAGRTVRLNIAHDWLTDPARRTRYDEELRARSRNARRDAGVGGVDAPPARPATTRPTVAKPVRARPSSSPKPVRARQRQAHAVPAWGDRRRWNDRRRVILVAAGSLAVIVVLGSLAVMGGAVGGSVEVEVTPPGGSAVLPTDASLPAGPSVAGSAATGTAGLVPTPGTTHVPPPTDAVVALSGAGDHEGITVTLEGGRYEVSYVVSSPAGDSCPWALYLTASDGLDLLMASAYPVDETVRDAESDSFVPEGKATVRVESGCPSWSATIRRMGP